MVEERTKVAHQLPSDSGQPAVSPSLGLDTNLCEHVGRAPIHQAWYKNDLLPAVGFLEFSNALDFPANVWNQSPVPIFAKTLMGLGGSIASLWTAFAVWDLLRSRKNLRFLWQERVQLKAECTSLSPTPEQQSHQRLRDAWLDVNFRELGWESIDRAIMDALMGFSGILIGAGTLMAIRGDIPEVFKVSNLLSGYVGNSFVALYGVLNAAFGAYMWFRARNHRSVILKMKAGIEPEFCHRLQSHVKKHQLYAILNSISVLVSAVGSLISATLWPGYVIIAPSIIGSVFCNLFWRHKLGYNRPSLEHWSGIQDTNLHDRLTSIITIHDTLRGKPTHSLDLEDIIPTKGELSNEDIIQFLRYHNLFDDFRSYLTRRKGQGGTLGIRRFNLESIMADDPDAVPQAAKSCIVTIGRRHFRDQERFLLEVYACCLTNPASGASGSCKGTLPQRNQD